MQDLTVCKLWLAVRCKRVALGRGKRCSTGGRCVCARDGRRIGCAWATHVFWAKVYYCWPAGSIVIKDGLNM
jgi:hypothetical protein